MDILITGASGFIGQALTQKLLKGTNDVFALDQKYPEDSQVKGLKDFYKQDITKEFKLDKSFDLVFHLAACNFTHVGKADYEAYDRVNVKGTENLIKSTKINNLVFLSTTKVYKNEGEPIEESTLLDPVGDYEKSKLQAENICRKYFPQERLTVFRSVNIIGPGQGEKAVIPVFFRNACENAPLEIIGAKETTVQLLSMEDLLRAFYLVLKRNIGCGTVNLSLDETITLEQLANKVIRLCDSKSQIHSSGKGKVVLTKVISNKAKDVLGWQAKVSIDEMLSDFYNLYSQNR